MSPSRRPPYGRCSTRLLALKLNDEVGHKLEMGQHVSILLARSHEWFACG